MSVKNSTKTNDGFHEPLVRPATSQGVPWGGLVDWPLKGMMAIYFVTIRKNVTKKTNPSD